MKQLLKFTPIVSIFFLILLTSCSKEISPTNGISKITSIYCNGNPTTIVNVTNPITGKIWMDRNLGASRAATSSNDTAAYGDLYQWGRGSDGHQCRNSGTTTTLSSSDQPGNANFIISPFGIYWLSTQNNNLWQGVNGVNNPCPIGYRLPTETEFRAEIASWTSNNRVGAINSPLKLTMAGYRDRDKGSLLLVGVNGYYWTSTVDGPNSWFLSSNAFTNNNFRVLGYSVRCLKD